MTNNIINMLSRRQLWRNQKNRIMTNKNYISKKKVSFNILVSVVLVPSRIDYINSDLIKLLWYQENDYIQFIKQYNKYIDATTQRTL